MRAVDLIQRKRDGGELSEEEIDFFVRGYVQGEIPDYQAAALAMSVFFRGMSPAERVQLAAGLGVDRAEELVEKLARRKGGLAPTVLLEAVHSAKAAEPAKLRSLLMGLKDREQRREILTEGLKTVGERVVEELAEEAPEPADTVPAAPPPPPQQVAVGESAPEAPVQAPPVAAVEEPPPEPEPPAAGAEAEAVLDEIAAKVKDLKDPDSGEPIIDKVFRRDETYSGPAIEQAADMIVHPCDGYDVKGTIKADSLTRREHLEGMHTYDDALLLTTQEMDLGPGNDISGITKHIPATLGV